MNDIYVGSLISNSYLEHHGIKGMHWGVRRFQREDGSLTSAGRKRKASNEKKNEAEKKRGLTDGQKRALKIAGGVAVGALAAYGGYKAYQRFSNPEVMKSIAESQRKKAISKAATSLFNTKASIGADKIAYRAKNGHTVPDDHSIMKREQKAYDKYHQTREKAEKKYTDTINKINEKQARKEAVKKMKDTVKNRHTLSEAELDAKLSRVKKELELKRVTAENLSSGRSEVDSIIRNAGKKAAGTAISGAMLYGIKYSLTKQYDAKDAANYVAPRPKNK